MGVALKSTTTLLYIGAAAAVAIAGMVHLMLGPGMFRFNINQGILFVVGGTAQIFWIIPMVRRWGPIWYYIGIAGNFAFFAIWLITRFPGNPINGRGDMRLGAMDIITEVCQLGFIGITAAILIHERRRRTKEKSKKTIITTTAATIKAKGPTQDEEEEEKHTIRKIPSLVSATSVPNRKRASIPLAVLSGIVIALILTSIYALPSLMPKPEGPGGGPPPPPTGEGQINTSGAGSSPSAAAVTPDGFSNQIRAGGPNPT